MARALRSDDMLVRTQQVGRSSGPRTQQLVNSTLKRALIWLILVFVLVPVWLVLGAIAEASELGFDAQASSRKVPGSTTEAAPAARAPDVSDRSAERPDRFKPSGFARDAKQWIGSEFSTWTINHTIALAIGVYTLFAVLQWRSLRKMVREANAILRNTERQAEVSESEIVELKNVVSTTEKVAHATMRSSDFAIRSYNAKYRPWVLISDCWLSRDDLGFLITCKAYNVGPLPATIVDRAAVSYVCFSSVDEPKFPPARPEIRVLPPNHRDSDGAEVLLHRPQFSFREFEEILAGRKSLAFFTYVHYKPPFRGPDGQGSVPYLTEFAAGFFNGESHASSEVRLPLHLFVLPIPERNRVT